MTNSEAVSKTINTFKYLNKDEHISRRYVLKLLKDSSKNLISQKLLDRTILNDENIYTLIPCLEFEKIDIIRCPIIEFRTCRIIMKSKKPLPNLIYSRNGNSIKEIISVDGLTDIYLTTPQKYRNSLKRKFNITKDVYLYVDSDNYAYILDKEILAVNIKLLTLDTDTVDDISGCSEDTICKSGWDYEFVVPDKLEEVVFKEVLQILSSTYAVRRQDENPNNIVGA